MGPLHCSVATMAGIHERAGCAEPHSADCRHTRLGSQQQARQSNNTAQLAVRQAPASVAILPGGIIFLRQHAAALTLS